MKSLTRIAVVGFSGVVLFKLVTAVLLPALAIATALVMLLVKLAIAAAVLYFLYTIFFDKNEDEPHLDGEIVVEVEEEIEVDPKHDSEDDEG